MRNYLQSSGLLLLLLFCTPFLYAQVVFVTPSGAGAKDGTSWADAYGAAQLQPKLRSAAPGTSFWVKAGTYTPHATSRDSAFVIPPGVKLYGGFAGNETTLAARSWATNKTILSGDIGKAKDSTDNSYHVVIINNADTLSTADGLYVMNGFGYTASYNGDEKGYGGGIQAGQGARIRNCTISGNTGYHGAGIAIYMPGYANKVLIENCIVEDNTSLAGSSTQGGGGGIRIFPGNNNNIIRNCTIRRNTTEYYGGGIYVDVSGGTSGDSIKSCIIDSNVAMLGAGAAVFNSNANVKFDDCSFIQNMSTSFGGGMYLTINPFSSSKPVFTIRGCTFDRNTGTSGAAISYNPNTSNPAYPKLNVYNSYFVSNKSTSASVDGIQDICSHNAFDTTTIAGCTFYNHSSCLSNLVTEAGHICSNFINNTCYNDSGIYAKFIQNDVYYPLTGIPEITMNVYNSIMWFNYPTSYGVGFGSSSYMYYNLANSSIRYMNNPSQSPYPGFVDTTPGMANLRLKCSSIQINKGDNAFITPTGISKDPDGNNRIYQSIVDPGAYENPLKPAKAICISSITGLSADFTSKTLYYDSLLWDFGDGQHSSKPVVAHTYAATGTYKVCLHAYSSCGNNDTCFNIVAKVDGISNAGNYTEQVSISPNPASAYIQLSGIQQPVTVTLYDINGRELKKETCTGNTRMDVQALPQGLYLLDIMDKQQGIRTVKKLLIRR